ncbi:hypothetical protein V8D89_007682 [Ganoderma adspersum]
MGSESSMSLNMDIMHAIMSYATRNTVSDLMKTCRAANSEGVKHLLKDGVSIGSEVELLSLVYFLTARGNLDDSLRRLIFFESLSLNFDTPSPDVARGLAEFFENIGPVALNFTSLDIHTAETLLTAYPPLGATIAKLTTLESLEISSSGEHCASLLRTLQSKLVTASITFDDGDEEDEDILERDRNPILLFRGSQSTLESLSTSFSASSPQGPRYANVTELSLSYLDLPSIEDYIRAFPNLRSLSAFECSGYVNDPAGWEERRLTSMGYQVRRGSWRSLRQYWGSVLILWIFGLTCRIPSVELDFEDDELDLDKLNDVLQDARPSRLILKLPEASCLLDERFRSSLHVDSLRVLDLRVTFSAREDSALSVGDILDSLVDVIRASSATSLELTLNWSCGSWMRSNDGGEGQLVVPFDVYLRDMDVDAYADTLFASAALLKKLQVSVVGPKRYKRQADRKRP